MTTEKRSQQKRPQNVCWTRVNKKAFEQWHRGKVPPVRSSFLFHDTCHSPPVCEFDALNKPIPVLSLSCWRPERTQQVQGQLPKRDSFQFSATEDSDVGNKLFSWHNDKGKWEKVLQEKKEKGKKRKGKGWNPVCQDPAVMFYPVAQGHVPVALGISLGSEAGCFALFCGVSEITSFHCSILSTSPQRWIWCFKRNLVTFKNFFKFLSVYYF